MQIVQYSDIQFTKVLHVLKGMGLDDLPEVRLSHTRIDGVWHGSPLPLKSCNQLLLHTITKVSTL